jgi:hypothetical protein
MKTSALRRLAVGVVAPAALALGLVACGGGDVSKDKFTSELEDKAQLTEAQATCVTDRLYDELDQDQINDIYEADTLEDADSEAFDVLTTATTECLTEE